MHTETGDPAAAVPGATQDVHDHPGAGLQTPAERAREEIGLLYVGFGLGVSIGAVFLVYILFEVAKLLP